MKLSVCIPVYNGSLTVGRLVRDVLGEMRKMKQHRTEIILVNDGSTDNSEEVCEGLAREHREVVCISLRRNFGEHNAVMCALNYASGDYAAIIDDDYQNAPGDIIELLAEAVKGYDVVYSRYNKRGHSPFRNFASRCNDIMSAWLLDKPRGLYLSSFKVIGRPVVREIIKYSGPFPYIDALILRVTDSISSVTVGHRKREAGKSNYTFRKLVSLWMNIVINYSLWPLRLFTVAGLAILAVGFILSLLFIVDKLRDPSIMAGWTSLIVAVIFFSGAQLVFLGLIGEYIAKQHMEINHKPQWVVKKEMLGRRGK